MPYAVHNQRVLNGMSSKLDKYILPDEVAAQEQWLRSNIQPNFRKKDHLLYEQALDIRKVQRHIDYTTERLVEIRARLRAIKRGDF